MNSPNLNLNDAEAEGSEPSLELKGLVHALLRRAWLIVLGALVVGFAAAAYVQRMPDQFESKTVLQVEPSQGVPIEKKDNRSDPDVHDPMLMETVIQNFRNRSLLLEVIRKLNLTEDAMFFERKTGLPASEDEVIERLKLSLSVSARPKTYLTDISFTHPNPDMARLLATTIVEQFFRQNTEQQLKQAEAQNASLLQKAAELREKVRKSEEAVQAYKNQMESVSMDTGRNLVETKLRDMNTNLSDARNERLKLESD